MSPLDHDRIAALYRRRAFHYDFGVRLVRLFGSRYLTHLEMAVGALGLRPGDRVVEIACGTGLNFPALVAAVGPGGRVIGVDLTDAMLERARRRVRRAGWRNVELVHADAATWPFPPGIHGILCTAGLSLISEYDDVIERAATALAPGGRMVVYDFKRREGGSGWSARLQALLRRPFGQTRDLAERRPWESLARHLPDFEMTELYGGSAYVAVGRKPDA